jgi:hypothetical protein
MTERTTVDVTPCARCGEDHEALALHRRSKPIQLGNFLYYFWALCPTTTRVLHVRIAQSGAEQS